VRFAYADPPYLGVAKKRYPDHPESWVYDTVEGHHQLIDRLVTEFPDGWALSMAATNLRELLPLCPGGSRVMVWAKTYTMFLKGVNPAYSWEPIIVYGGRKRGLDRPTLRDWLALPSPHVRGRAFTGQKPEQLCYWLFDVLGMQADDELVDLFPGSGAVARAWESWRNQAPLGLGA